MWGRMGINTSVIPPPLFLKLLWSPNYSEFTHLRHQTIMTVTSPSLPHYVPAPRTTAECTLSFPIILDRWWWPTVFFHSGVCRSDGHRSFKGEYSRRSCWACYSSPRWHAWTRVYLCHQPWNNPRTGDLGFFNFIFANDPLNDCSWRMIEFLILQIYRSPKSVKRRRKLMLGRFVRRVLTRDINCDNSG